MKIPGLRCNQCGGESLRRSKRQSVWELANMSIGVYPFRCMDCGSRFWVSVWLFSKLGIAKCPKCLRTEVLEWPEKYFRPSPWQRMLFTFGAHRYRCAACRYNFISFRPRKGSSSSGPPQLPPEAEAAESQNPASVAEN